MHAQCVHRGSDELQQVVGHIVALHSESAQKIVPIFRIISIKSEHDYRKMMYAYQCVMCQTRLVLEVSELFFQLILLLLCLQSQLFLLH